MNNKKVFVGMSGGVDSSVSAYLLKQAGYDVTGVFIKVWQPDFIECTWKEDRLDAMRVAAHLDIPFVTLDLEKEYKSGVIDYMMHEYKEGRTPNPDVMCNREVKFGAFWKWAKSHGADYIATGHYSITDNTKLFVSKDKDKDQTYFLWKLTYEDLSHVLFPIGHLEKSAVRAIAKEVGIPVADKKDSQGLCFVGTIDVKEFLKIELGIKKGDVEDENGTVIGFHDGVMFYTLGERHGFTVTNKTISEKPYYILKKDTDRNVLVVGHEKPKISHGGRLKLMDISWVTKPVSKDFVYMARSRYRAPLAKVSVKCEGDDTTVTVLEGELLPVPGQSLVFYDEKHCLGGGIVV